MIIHVYMILPAASNPSMSILVSLPPVNEENTFSSSFDRNNPIFEYFLLWIVLLVLASATAMVILTLHAEWVCHIYRNWVLPPRGAIHQGMISLDTRYCIVLWQESKQSLLATWQCLCLQGFPNDVTHLLHGEMNMQIRIQLITSCQQITRV